MKETTIKEVGSKLFYTAKEFGIIAGVSKETVYRWNNIGLIQMKQFTPKCKMIPLSEVERFNRGEMMEER